MEVDSGGRLHTRKVSDGFDDILAIHTCQLSPVDVVALRDSFCAAPRQKLGDLRSGINRVLGRWYVVQTRTRSRLSIRVLLEVGTAWSRKAAWGGLAVGPGSRIRSSAVQRKARHQQTMFRIEPVGGTYKIVERVREGDHWVWRGGVDADFKVALRVDVVPEAGW